MRISWKKIKEQWPFIGFSISYALLFYMFGHIDARVTTGDTMQAVILGALFHEDDLYFTFLTFMFIFLMLTIFFAFLIAEKKTLNWKQFGLFILAGLAILPNSVWGLAWHVWFNMKTTGSLNLWKILSFKIAIPWSIYLATQYVLTFVYIGITIGFIYWLAKK